MEVAASGPEARPAGLAPRRSLATRRTLEDSARSPNRVVVSRATAAFAQVRGRSGSRTASPRVSARSRQPASRSASTTCVGSSVEHPGDARPRRRRARSSGEPAEEDGVGAERESAASDVEAGADPAVDVHLRRSPDGVRPPPAGRPAVVGGPVELAAAVVGHPHGGGARVDAPPGVVGTQHALDHHREPGASRRARPMSSGPRSRRLAGARRRRRSPGRSSPGGSAGSTTSQTTRSPAAYLVPTTGVSTVSTTASAPAVDRARRAAGRRASRSCGQVDLQPPAHAGRADVGEAGCRRCWTRPSRRRPRRWPRGHRELALGVHGALQGGRRDAQRHRDRPAEQRARQVSTSVTSRSTRGRKRTARQAAVASAALTPSRAPWTTYSSTSAGSRPPGALLQAESSQRPPSSAAGQRDLDAGEVLLAAAQHQPRAADQVVRAGHAARGPRPARC